MLKINRDVVCASIMYFSLLVGTAFDDPIIDRNVILEETEQLIQDVWDKGVFQGYCVKMTHKQVFLFVNNNQVIADKFIEEYSKLWKRYNITIVDQPVKGKKYLIKPITYDDLEAWILQVYDFGVETALESPTAITPSLLSQAYYGDIREWANDLLAIHGM